MTSPKKSIKSKSRVREQGEVFTAEREVMAMLDLVRHETESIYSRFLEPACGDGNFLAPVLQKKLQVVEKTYRKSQLEYERNALIAIGSVYGVDILRDNVADCQERLYKHFESSYRHLYKAKCKPSICLSAKFILTRNILWGDALSLRTPDENSTPIVFSEWSRPFNDSRFKRHDYDFREIVMKDDPDLIKEYNISDFGDKVFKVHPVASFPLVHMAKLGESL